MKKSTVLRLYVEIQNNVYVSDISDGSKQIIVNDIMEEFATDPERFYTEHEMLLKDYVYNIMHEYTCDISDYIEYKYGEHPTVTRYNRMFK